MRSVQNDIMSWHRQVRLKSSKNFNQSKEKKRTKEKEMEVILVCHG